jgi:hypothetical protein
MNSDNRDETSDHQAIREYLAREARGEGNPGKKMVLNPQTGKFFLRSGDPSEDAVPSVSAEDMQAFGGLTVTVANLIASGIIGNAAYALLTSTIGRFRARISKTRSGGVESLEKDEALNLARGLIASRIGCDPYSLESVSRLYDADDKSWTISLSRGNTRYHVQIPFGDPAKVECVLW